MKPILRDLPRRSETRLIALAIVDQETDRFLQPRQRANYLELIVDGVIDKKHSSKI